jgi:hypothetical protein
MLSWTNEHVVKVKARLSVEKSTGICVFTVSQRLRGFFASPNLLLLRPGFICVSANTSLAIGSVEVSVWEYQ